LRGETNKFYKEVMSTKLKPKLKTNKKKK